MLDWPRSSSGPGKPRFDLNWTSGSGPGSANLLDQTSMKVQVHKLVEPEPRFEPSEPLEEIQKVSSLHTCIYLQFLLLE